VVADGVDEADESESLDDEPVSLEDDEPVSLDVDVVVVSAVVLGEEVVAHARPLSASAAAAVSATAQRRSARMRRRPWSRVRVE
jgi:hypothetical protein